MLHVIICFCLGNGIFFYLLIQKLFFHIVLDDSTALGTSFIGSRILEEGVSKMIIRTKGHLEVNLESLKDDFERRIAKLESNVGEIIQSKRSKRRSTLKQIQKKTSIDV